MEGSYIKLYRDLVDWEWYHKINTCRLFIHMLLKANWKDANFEGQVIKRGSFVSSLRSLSEETDLTIDEIRTALKHLQKTKEITTHTNRKYTVFTVVNYEKYQTVTTLDTTVNPTDVTKPIPNYSQTIPNNRRNKEGNIKKEDTNVSEKKVFKPPTVDEVRAYCLERNNQIDAQSFVDFYTSKGWMIGKNRMKDWKAAVRTWERSRKNTPVSGKNKFNDFEQKEMSKEDFASLEEELLGYGFDV